MSWEERIINYPWIEEYYIKKNNFLVQCREQSCKKTYRYVQFAKNFKKHLSDTHSAVYEYEEENKKDKTWKNFRLTEKEDKECILCETDAIEFSPDDTILNHVEKHLSRQQTIRMSEKEDWRWKYLKQIGDFSAKCRLCANNTEIIPFCLTITALKNHSNVHGQTIKSIQYTWKNQTEKHYFLNKCYTKPVNLRSECQVCKQSFVCMEIPLLKQHFLQKHTFIYNIEESKEKSRMEGDNWKFFRFTRQQVKETIECITCEKPVQNELRQIMYHRYTHRPQYQTIRLPNWEFKYLRQEEDIVKCRICDENLNYRFQIMNLKLHAATHTDNMKRIDKEETFWKQQTEKNNWLQKCYIDAGDFRAECKFCERKEIYIKNEQFKKHIKEKHFIIDHLETLWQPLEPFQSTWKCIRYTGKLNVGSETECMWNCIRYIGTIKVESEKECMICQKIISYYSKDACVSHLKHPSQLLEKSYFHHWAFKYAKQNGNVAKCTACKENVDFECDMDNLKNHMSSVHPKEWERIQKDLEQATAHDQAGPSTSYAN